MLSTTHQIRSTIDAALLGWPGGRNDGPMPINLAWRKLLGREGKIIGWFTVAEGTWWKNWTWRELTDMGVHGLIEKPETFLQPHRFNEIGFYFKVTPKGVLYRRVMDMQLDIEIDAEARPVYPSLMSMEMNYEGPASAPASIAQWMPGLSINLRGMREDEMREVFRRLAGMPGFPGSEEEWLDNARASIPELPEAFKRRVDLE